MTASLPALVLAAALASAAAAPAMAQPATAPVEASANPVVTSHALVLGGRQVAYTAEAGLLPIRDVATGEPHASMFYVAFRLSQPAGAAPRPLMFVWNGGPGADSTTLDFHVAGPKRLVNGRLADNPQTWLAFADLVFVDPVGAGFSRPAKAEYSDEFYGTTGDVRSVAEFVRSWRLVHGRNAAPLFLAGESWGAGRAGSVAFALEKRRIPVSGVVMISGGAGLNTARLEPPMAEAMRLPDMAATAQFYARAGRGQAPEAFRAEAGTWARAAYAPALKDPASLSDPQRDEIVRGLARFTGLPEAGIDRKTLRVTPRQFRENLVPGRPLQTYDMRRPATDHDEDAGAGAIVSFLREDLGWRTDAPYVGLEPIEDGYLPNGKAPEAVNERWNYATGPVTPEQAAAAIAEASRTGGGPPRLGAPLPSTEELVALDPQVRVLVAAGQYNSLNSCAANAETGRSLSPALQGAVSFRCYTGGHMFYRYDEPTRVAFSRDLEAFVRTASRRSDRNR